jgi:hypothetical protein
MLQYAKGLMVICSVISDTPLQALDCLHVVRKDIQAAERHDLNQVLVSTKVGSQALDQYLGTAGLEQPNSLGEMVRPLVFQLVSVD